MALQTISRINHLASSNKDFEQILQETVETVCFGLNYYAAAVLLLDDTRQCAILKAVYGVGIPHKSKDGITVSLIGNSSISAALESAETQIQSSTPSSLREYFPEAKVEISCPINVGNSTIGVLCTYLDREISPNSEEVTTCQLIADLIGNAYLTKKLHRELRTLTRQSEHRMRLQLAANQIAIAAGQPNTIRAFLQEVVDLLCDAYGLYYSGIFLVDNRNKWAVLQAGYGTAGALMVQNGHQLRIGGNSMVGIAIRLNETRIAMNIGEERIHFRNPHLPDTRSEMAIPLHLGDSVLGAITIQSREEAAFRQDDILSLQTLAHFLSPPIWLYLHK